MASKESTINFSKLRKGMVFWYDPNPDIDKNNVPSKTVNGFAIKDYTMYGDRPYVVVSSDDVCRLGRVVQVCPIGTKDKDTKSYPYDVVYNSFSGTGLSVIRCEQIRTVNSAELHRYECMLDDDIMDQVAEKLQALLGIDCTESEVEVPVVSMTSEEVEELVDAKMISVKEETTSMIDAAVARILNAFSAFAHNKSNNILRPLSPAPAAEDNQPMKHAKRSIIVTERKKRLYND